MSPIIRKPSKSITTTISSNSSSSSIQSENGNKVTWKGIDDTIHSRMLGEVYREGKKVLCTQYVRNHVTVITEGMVVKACQEYFSDQGLVTSYKSLPGISGIGLGEIDLVMLVNGEPTTVACKGDGPTKPCRYSNGKGSLIFDKTTCSRYLDRVISSILRGKKEHRYKHTKPENRYIGIPDEPRWRRWIAEIDNPPKSGLNILWIGPWNNASASLEIVR